MTRATWCSTPAISLKSWPNNLGLMAANRDDDKGTEPEMVEIATVAGRTYAFVALERTTESVAAVFDVTDPLQRGGGGSGGVPRR